MVDCSVRNDCKLAVSSILLGGIKSGVSDRVCSALLSSIRRLKASTPRSTSWGLAIVDEEDRSEFARNGLSVVLVGVMLEVEETW